MSPSILRSSLFGPFTQQPVLQGMGRLLMLWKGSFTGTWSAKDVGAVEVTTIRGSEDTGGCDNGFGHSQVGFQSSRD